MVDLTKVVSRDPVLDGGRPNFVETVRRRAGIQGSWNTRQLGQDLLPGQVSRSGSLLAGLLNVLYKDYHKRSGGYVS